jgi:predicted nucleic-acid-binding Zn-ribbon protein
MLFLEFVYNHLMLLTIYNLLIYVLLMLILVFLQSFYFFMCWRFWCFSDLSSMSCLVVLVDFDEVLIEPKSKVVDVDNDTFWVHDIISSYANDTCPKCRFLNIDEKSLQNVNKGGQRINKHVKMWAKNAFDKWWELWGFDTKKFIIDLAKDEQTIMELEDMVVHVHFSNCKEGC